MSRNCWEDICTALRYTLRPAPEFVDKFHPVRELQDAFNEYYKNEYCPGWWNCLDESMSVWYNKFCPGFMCVPRKPHPFGNEYHTICDGELDGPSNPILWHAEIQEGKDRPVQLGPKKYDEKGKTVGLMCRMVEPIKSSGKCVTMDSGFNVSMGIVDMERVQGVYGQALIKKRGRFWPKGVPGDAIDDHFRDKAIGHSETLQLLFDGHPFFIHCTKGLFICLIF